MKGSVELWGSARERFHPLPYPAPTGRSPLVRGGIVGGEEKRNGTTLGLGFRVWKVRVNKVNKDRLKVLYNDVIYKRNGNIPKGLLYYWEEWARMYENAKRLREEAGKRTLPKAPPLLLLVKFIMPDGRVRGNTAAPAVIDLRRGELRIPSYGVVQRLRRSLVRALIEENLLEPRPDFVLQVTRRGFLRIVAHRRLRARLELPLKVVTIDENSRHGHSLAHWYINETKVAMAGFKKMRPVNHGFRREIAALLQSFADKPCEEAKRQLAKFLPPEKLETLTTERARELVEKTRGREKRLNSDFISRLIAKARTLVRDAVRRGMSALILVEPIDSSSLRGTELQGTLLRGRKLLMNLAVYEGAKVGKASASGKVCPRCGTKGTEVVHTKRSRIYECPKCHLRWDRDKGVHYNMLVNYFEKLRKEECDDDSVLAERVLSLLREWLEKYSHILAY
jgi:ribosomal protein S27AE